MTASDTTTHWIARGFTDDITTCDHCGREDLKGTVRMVAIDPDGGDDGEQYMGVVCAARMTGRKATDIRTEANRADRAREQAVRDTWRAWTNAHTTWFCALRDATLGAGARYPQIQAMRETPEFQAAEAAWLAGHPKPPQP